MHRCGKSIILEGVLVGDWIRGLLWRRAADKVSGDCFERESGVLLLLCWKSLEGVRLSWRWRGGGDIA